MIKNFKTLEIWKRSCRLVKTIYSIPKKFPAEERYGLTFKCAGRQCQFLLTLRKAADAEVFPI